MVFNDLRLFVGKSIKMMLSLPSANLSAYSVSNRSRQEYEMRSTRQCALRKSHKCRHFMTALFQSFLSNSFNHVTDTIE
jgi:hypothetical protein